MFERTGQTPSPLRLLTPTPTMPQKKRSLDTLLRDDPPDPPDLTGSLKLNTKRITGSGSLSVVYRCLDEQGVEVAVKAIIFPSSFNLTEKEEFVRRVRREFGIWKRLKNLNIVPLLGVASGRDFGSDYPCIVSTWMPNGILFDYIEKGRAELSLSNRVRLIRGIISGLEFLHSQCIVHGDLHPANILIDGEHNPRITDFGLSQTLRPLQGKLSYLHTNTSRAGAVLWAAPELLSPELYPKLNSGATLKSDIYSLGSIILYILSGQYPWRDSGEATKESKEFRNPQRPRWPVNMPDGVWNFIERCWSPRDPSNRPLAQDVMSFCSERLEQLLVPDPECDINVVLFGAVGSGKSSIVNLLAGNQVARISSDVEPCTKKPKCYEIPIHDRRFRLWDTTGFSLASDGDISPLSPYAQGDSVLRNLPHGVDLILLCAKKDQISSSLPSLDRLYWLLNDFFHGGRAPIALVVTNFDTPDDEWWERNKRDIARRTHIPVETIPRECVTTTQTGCAQSKRALELLLQTYATMMPPIPLCLDPSSYAAASDLVSRCKISDSDATLLAENSSNLFNVVFFGEAGVGKSSVINLIGGGSIAPVNPDAECRTLGFSKYEIDLNMKRRFCCWETIGFKGIRRGHDLTRQAVEDAVQLYYDLSGKSGIDLLVFVKRAGRLTLSERNCYKLFQEWLCRGQVPVALVITCLEDHEPEQWWGAYGESLLRDLGGGIVDHACVTSLAGDDLEDPMLCDKVSKSGRALQTMLKKCVSESFPGEKAAYDQLPVNWGGKMGRAQEKMTLTKRELTEKLIRLYSGGILG